MDFDLVKPCPRCPFRTDCLEGWLGRARAQEIVESITLEQASFPCHETTNHDDDEGDYVPGGSEKHCAGALIMLEKSGIGPGQLARIAERLGQGKQVQLDLNAPVFHHTEDFVDHHSREGEVEEEGEPCDVADMGCLAPAGYAVGGGVIHNHVEPGATKCCPDCGTYVCANCTCYCEGEE